MLFLSNALQILGVFPIGYLCFFAIKTLPYYIKNKHWPAHPAELARAKDNEIATIAMAGLKERNQMLLDRIEELESDMEDIWKKTLARLPEK